MTSSSRPVSLLALALTAAIAALVGAYAGAAAGPGVRAAPAGAQAAAPPEDASERARSLARILERLDAVDRSLEQLGARIAQPERRPAGAAAGGDVETRLDALSTEVERLRRAVASLASSGGDGGPLHVPSGAPLESLPDRDAEDFRERVHGLQLSTYQQVLDRYGRPDEIRAGQGGMQWDYLLGGGGRLRLQFVDGILASTYTFD